MREVTELALYEYVKTYLISYINKEEEGGEPPAERWEQVKKSSEDFEGYDLFIPNLYNIKVIGQLFAEFDADFLQIYYDRDGGRIESISDIVNVAINTIINTLTLDELE